MRFLIVCTVLAVAAPVASAQKPPKAPKSITLNGCVTRDEKAPDQFILTDVKAKRTYRLSGLDFREYLGRPVQIDGGVVIKGVTVKGGLQPNPNVAAQAGAIDPSRAMVQSATSGSGTGTAADVEEFRAKAIRPGEGTCK
jgi:hypothetical protein